MGRGLRKVAARHGGIIVKGADGKTVRLKPADREKAALAISFFLSRAEDWQIKNLLDKTIQDWVDWLFIGKAKPKRRSYAAKAKGLTR